MTAMARENLNSQRTVYDSESGLIKSVSITTHKDKMNSEDIVYRLKKRAEIRRQIPTRKSVQEGAPDRIADLLEEAALVIEKLRSGDDLAKDLSDIDDALWTPVDSDQYDKVWYTIRRLHPYSAGYSTHNEAWHFYYDDKMYRVLLDRESDWFCTPIDIKWKLNT